MSTSRLIRLLLPTVLGAMIIGGCSFEQEFGYVQSADGTLSFRYPADWTDVQLDPVASEWVAGIDGAAVPSADNAETLVLDNPFVVAQVLALEPQLRDQATLGQLRQLALTDQRDPLTDDPTIRVRFHQTLVDEVGFEGHHIRFELDLEGQTIVEEHLAVFDPERTTVQRVRVACSMTCFDENTDSIEEIFRSIAFREAAEE
ncbi:MAG: hypothetical protein AAF547_10715 [Actinomycetota bacterium]